MKNHKTKTRKIKNHIIIVTLTAVMIPLVVLGIFACYACYTTSTTYVLQNVENSAKEAAQHVHWQVKSYQNIALETGGNTRLISNDVSDKDKQATVDNIVTGYGLDRGTVIKADGKALDGNDYSDRSYFQETMKGKAVVTEPLVSRVTGKATIIITAPIWKDGIFGGTVAGVVIFAPNPEFLNDITREISVSENSMTYIINKEGTMIAAADADMVTNGVNYIEQAKTDSLYTEFADVQKKMIAQEMGSARANAGETIKLIGYAPIPDSDGWSVAVSAPASDFLQTTYMAMGITAALIVFAALISLVSATMIGKHIGDPLSACADRMNKFAEGDLKSPVPNVRRKDEMKVLADAAADMVSDINKIIGDIQILLSSMAGGDFTVTSQCGEDAYRGDFHTLFAAVRDLKCRLNHTLSQISISSEQVSVSSEQVSGGAQSLSQGASEQAGALEKLTASMQTIQGKVTETSENCEDGKQLMEETVQYITQAADDMRSLTVAMDEIHKATDEINKMNKAIEDIAFQTNILALNAAVEATRAGQAGKGFAVVADEVRNLANKAAEASRTTTELIERTIKAVGNGVKITTETAEAVATVQDRSVGVKRVVDSIAAASREQAEMVEQATGGIDQISGVVQTVSATAQESAASAQQLSALAQTLKDAVEAFHLK